MIGSEDTISMTKGDIICRSSGWIDVVKFFLLNYGVHALTVIPTPGSGHFNSINTTLSALLLPYSGIVRALQVIYNFAVGEASPLKTAQRAGALCAMVRLPGKNQGSMHFISPITKIHGQHPIRDTNPVTVSTASGRESAGVSYGLVFVPQWFDVKPLMATPAKNPPEVNLACNYSVLKACAAIGQILYASFELYEARGRQFQKFGYAAYSLTVIPYILMSLANLAANFCCPQYPSMYLVLHRGEHMPSEDRRNHEQETEDLIRGYTAEELVSCAVGETSGDFFRYPDRKVRDNALLRSTTVCLVAAGALTAPYIIIQLLTGFKARESNFSQQLWTMTSLVVSQAIGPLLFLLRYYLSLSNKSKKDHMIWQTSTLLITMLSSSAAFGSFVVVANMILQDEVCTKI